MNQKFSRFFRVSLYYFIGLLLLVYVVLNIHQNMATLSTNSAMVTTAVHVVEAQMDGSVTSISAEPDQDNDIGEPLLQMTSPDLELQIVQARQELKEAILQKSVAEKEAANHSLELQQFKETLERKKGLLDDNLSKCSQNVSSCEYLFVKCNTLWRHGVINSDDLLKATTLLHEQRKELAAVKVGQENNDKAIKWAEKGYIFTESKVNWGTLSANQAIEVANGVVEAKTEKLKSLENLSDLLTLSSPVKGKVRMLVGLGNFVKAGEPVAVIEELGDCRVEAFVDRKSLGKIALGDKVKVISDLSETLDCDVLDIDFNPDLDGIRSAWSVGALTDVGEGFVSIRLDLEDNAKALVPGYPVRVEFQRRSFRPWKKNHSVLASTPR